MWGVCTAGFSVCRSLNEGYLFWAINGIGLSLVIPTGQSLIADYYQVGSMIRKLLCNLFSEGIVQQPLTVCT